MGVPGVGKKIRARVFFMVFGIAGIVVFLFYQWTNNLLIKNYLQKPDNELPLLAFPLVSGIESLREDVLFLTGTPPIQGIIRAGKNGGVDPFDNSSEKLWRNRLAIIFTEFLKAKPHYLNIRYIGLAGQGKEIVHVERSGKNIHTVPRSSLQSKGHRPYFQKAVLLKKAEVYLSQVNLNREHKKVVEPHIPVLRGAVPVYTPDNKVFGIVIINMHIGPNLMSIQNTKNNYDHYITNDEGDFLRHPDASMTFGFDRGNRHRIQDTYPELAELFQPGNRTLKSSVLSKTREHNRVVHFLKVPFDPLHPERFLALAKAVNYQQVVAESIGFSNRIILPILTFLLAVIGLVFYFLQSDKPTPISAKADENSTRNKAEVTDHDSKETGPGSIDRVIKTIAQKLFPQVSSEDIRTFDQNRASEKKPALSLIVLGCLFAVGVFALDISLPLGVATGVPYVVLVLIALWMPRRYIFLAAITGTLLTILGFFLSPEGGELWKVIWNRFLAFFVIWGVALLGLIHQKLLELWQMSEKRLRSVMDNAADGIITIDSKGIVESINPATEKIFGYATSELVGENINMLMPEPHHSEHDSYIKRYLKSGQGKVIGMEARDLLGKRKDGSSVPVSVAVTKMWIKNQLLFIGMIRDITERKMADEELRKSRELFKALAQMSPVGIWRSDSKGGYIYLNKCCSEIIGCKPEEAVGEGWTTWLHPDDRGRVIREWDNSLKNEGHFKSEYRFKPPNKDTKWVIGQASTERDLTGKIIGYVGTLTDITELKRIQGELQESKEKLESRVEKRTAELKSTHQKLMHSEKLSATGKLSASIAHEFNNPIFGIRNVLVEVEEGLKLDESYEYMVNLAIKECDRMSDLTKKLQDFHQPSPGVAMPLDVHEAIDDVVMLIKKKMQDKNIGLNLNYAPHLPKIHIVQDQFKQVFLNIIQNAIDAISSASGEIGITTEQAGSVVKISVLDTGCGIPPDIIKSIFDPFFTTKSAVKGTGLGLSISYGIVKAHGGDINIDSQINGGTVITISFPITKSE